MIIPVDIQETVSSALSTVIQAVMDNYEAQGHGPPTLASVQKAMAGGILNRLTADETPDRRLVYFHRNSVVNADFDSLEIGTEVRFVERTGDEGPQASSVTVAGKHHVVG